MSNKIYRCLCNEKNPVPDYIIVLEAKAEERDGSGMGAGWEMDEGLGGLQAMPQRQAAL